MQYKAAIFYELFIKNRFFCLNFNKKILKKPLLIHRLMTI